MQKIADINGMEFNGKFFVVKENLIPYNDAFALDYGIETNQKSDFISFNMLKKLHERCVFRWDDIKEIKGNIQYIKMR